MIDDIKKFMSKVKEIEKSDKLDLSSGEDLSIGIMNLISIEEHLFFSANKTGKEEYYALLKEVREMRKGLMKQIIKDYEGEVWCISKHLLASSMRLMEVGTKYQGKGDDKNAKEMFEKAYKLYNLFWGLNLGLVKMDDMKSGEIKVEEMIEDKVNFVPEKTEEGQATEAKTESLSIFEKLGKVIQKAVDCCRE
ncbi:MAG: hypothetical protein ACD_22C00170G0009 [uncultured bacterium]|nr:MAG: hypothetical protein ACD_22C00170G0009 [uncultured bacterium]